MKLRKVVGGVDLLFGILIFSVNYRIIHGGALPEESSVVVMSVVTVLGLVLVMSGLFLLLKE